MNSDDYLNKMRELDEHLDSMPLPAALHEGVEYTHTPAEAITLTVPASDWPPPGTRVTFEPQAGRSFILRIELPGSPEQEHPDSGARR